METKTQSSWRNLLGTGLRQWHRGCHVSIVLSSGSSEFPLAALPGAATISSCLPLGTKKEPIYFFVSLEGYCWGRFVCFDFEGVHLFAQVQLRMVRLLFPKLNVRKRLWAENCKFLSGQVNSQVRFIAEFPFMERFTTLTRFPFQYAILLFQREAT